MAAAVVNRLCAPAALALKRAGLEYLLFDEARAQAIRSGAQEAVRVPEYADGGERALQESAAGSQNPARNTRKKNESQVLPRDSSPRPGTERPNAAPSLAAWPADWQERLKKTRGAPVIWTYWELGCDLCGEPEPKRRDLLRDLLKELAHPPGTHSFWPLSLPRQGEDGEQVLEANAPIFWEGIRLLHGRAVVIMGAETVLRALALPDRLLTMCPFQQVRYQGRLLVVLPPPDLIVREARRIQSLREFLRKTLTPFA